MKQFCKLLEMVRQKQSVDLFTVVGVPTGEEKYLGYCSSGKFAAGFPGDEFPEALQVQLDLSIAGMTWRKPILLTLETPGAGIYQVFWDRAVSRSRAIVLGGGHISQPLVEILAMLDFSPIVVDDRMEFANQRNFPHAETILCQPFQKALEQLEIDSETAVIIVTRGHRYDLECLRAVLERGARYLGMIGSRRRVKGIMALLKEEGVPESLLATIQSPIGLELGAETPAEIAVSIAAEVVSVFRSGNCTVGCRRKGGVTNE